MTNEPIIIAIGGRGDFGPDDTEPIDRYIVARTGQAHPHALFIPTASNDDQDYIERFTHAYEKLGCDCEALTLTRRDWAPSEVQAAVDRADLIYVGGGNTLFLLNYWRFVGLDDRLHAAWRQGKVLAGLSAGCIVWHQFGLTDSVANEYRLMYGLGWLEYFVTPHYDGEPGRREIFQRLVVARGYPALAVDDRCALVYRDTTLAEVIQAHPDHHAYRLGRDPDGRLTSEVLPARLLS